MEYCTDPHDYYLSEITEYPSLYLKENFDYARFSLLDQALNTNGNGLFNYKGFVCNSIMADNEDGYENVAEFTSNPDITHTLDDITSGKLVHIRPQYSYWIKEPEFKYITNPLYHVRSEHKWVTPVEATELLKETVTLEGHTLPKYKLLDINPIYEKRSPYPNFQKEFSTLWGCRVHGDGTPIDFSKFSKAWIKEFIWFYEQCKEYFNSSEVHHFTYYPRPRNKCELLKAMLDKLNHLGETEITQKYLDAINHHYTGYGFNFTLENAFATAVPSFENDETFYADDVCDDDSLTDYKEIKVRFKLGDKELTAHATHEYHKQSFERWERSKAKYMEFIDETIKMLEQYL